MYLGIEGNYLNIIKVTHAKLTAESHIIVKDWENMNMARMLIFI